MYYNVFVLFFSGVPFTAIDVSVHHNGGLLPDILLLLLTQGYLHHRGTRLNAMKRFCLCCSLYEVIPPKRFDIFPPDWGMLRRSRCVQTSL